jgi:predicted O-methyltransferase YrrM
MIKDVELFYEPLEILDKLSQNGAMMSRDEHAFLCGLIRTYRPKKIVEVGVSRGGTTAVLLNCISSLNLEAELFSVDISERCYVDTSRQTGYLGEESKKYLTNKVSHKRYFGVLPEFLDQIGDDVDFVILDTAHKMPGEILDFIACLPKLCHGALVVLHDLTLNHENYISKNSFATRILLSSVVGGKAVRDNIGAILVTDDTSKNIENAFSSLMVSWSYLPKVEHIEIYRNWYSKYYKKELTDEFETAVRMNTATLKNNRLYETEMFRHVFAFCNTVKDQSGNVYIYGCGNYGRKLCRLLDSFGIEVEGYLISDGQEKPCLDRPVKFYSEVNGDICTIVLGMGRGNQMSLNIDTSSFISMDDYVLGFVETCI